MGHVPGLKIQFVCLYNGGHAVAQLVDYATSQKVAGSIPYYVIGIFH
jgi:hypothetical protein